MHHSNQQLRLDQRATYRIQVQGCVGDDWADWFDGIVVTVKAHPHGPSTTTLTGTLIDQAALQGLLSKLYNLGLPLLSVQILSCRR